ncbi:Bud13 [Penicillium chermesinum]|uniref:Bud13 n=1 Tax=Penicillium chermesinum TaxID=63820 RepID=A0A9W9TEE8_9EURO|nr:Bud13 [Penicillium chermesinum]KAJ5219603.1 Bud13 [Penicillium chermesinum]
MPGSLADYLAKNYLNADPAPERPKKKRKKTKTADTADTGITIADDDPPDLRNFSNTAPDDEDSPFIDTSTATTEFRRTKKSNWKTVSGPDPNEQAAADAILASAAAERATQQGVDDEAPMIEDTEGDGPRMESGARAGLQTAEQTAAMAQETIYRDASGRIINVAMKRAEARRAEEEKRKAEERARESLLGDVQRQQREERKQQLQDIKTMPVARGIDDEERNAELRGAERWNDPAAAFLTEKTTARNAVSGKPLYKGSFQPNRYGIRPGHRWDGVDRSTGFEKEWFAARNKKDMISTLEYQWQMDE